MEDRLLLSLTGGEFHVNASTASNQFDTANASAANGMSVVVWTHRVSSSNTDIKAQLYNANGTRRGGEVTVAGSPRNESQGAVSMDATGDFVIVWTDFNNTAQVRAQRFTSTGVRRGSVISVAITAAGENEPSVAAAANGDFVVSYTIDRNPLEPNPFADPRFLSARMYADSGTLLRTITVQEATDCDATHSSVARAQGADARFSIAFASHCPQTTIGHEDPLIIPESRNIVLNLYSASGQSLFFNDGVSLNAGKGRNPSVAIDNSGNTLVGWQEATNGLNAGFDILARKVNKQGVLGSLITVRATAGEEVDPSIAIDRSDGDFVVGYTLGMTGTERHVLVTELSSAGTIRRTIDLGARRAQPSISINGADKYIVTYTGLVSRPGDPGFGIYGRFGIL